MIRGRRALLGGAVIAGVIVVAAYARRGDLVVAAAPEVVRYAGPPADERPARPSTGCGAARSPGLARASVMVDGERRSFEMLVPATYDASRPRPLVLAFHGSGGDGAGFRAQTRLDERAERDGVVVLFPDAVVRTVWADHRATHWGKVEDLPFFDALVAYAEEGGCIDRGRVFAFGWSSGGYFANQLGCARPERVRAIASLSGGGPEKIACDHPMPTFLFHDRGDGAVSIGTGRESRDAWRKTNRCAGRTHDEGGCLVHEGCEAPLVWCETTGNGHGMPPSAIDAAWAFFGAFR